MSAHSEWAAAEAETMIARGSGSLADLFTSAIVMLGSIETAPERYTEETGQQSIPTLPQMIRQHLPVIQGRPSDSDDAVRWATSMLIHIGAPALSSDVLGWTNTRQAIRDMAAAGWFNNTYRNDTGKEPPPWIGAAILHAYDALEIPS